MPPRHKVRKIDETLFIFLDYPGYQTRRSFERRFGVDTYFTTDEIPVDATPEMLRRIALPPQDCEESFRAFELAQGRAQKSDVTIYESRLTEYNWPYELRKKWVRLYNGKSVQLWVKVKYTHACGLSYEFWMNFGDNGNSVRSAGTKLKGPTEYLRVEVRNIDDYNAALGPLLNIARAFDGTRSDAVDQQLAVMNLFSNMAHVYVAEVEGFRTRAETFRRLEIGGNRREAIEILQRRILIGGEKIAVLSLDDMLAEWLERPYMIKDLNEYALTQATVEAQAGINTRQGPIPPRNRWIIPWEEERHYRGLGDPNRGFTEPADLVDHRNRPILVAGPEGVYFNVSHPANLDILDRMHRQAFPGTPFVRNITVPDRHHPGTTRNVIVEYDDEERFLRLRRAWFEDQYPRWAASLTITTQNIDQLTDAGRIFQQGELSEDMGERYDREAIDLTEQDHRKDVLKLFPRYHSELVRARVLGALHRVRDFPTERLILREVARQNWSRGEFARLILGRDYGVFAREPSYDLVVEVLQRTNQAEREETHLDAILNPRYENLMAWFLYLADLFDVFVNKWAAKLDPTPGAEWWSFGWGEFMTALNGGLLLGYGTQRQQLQLARLLGEAALIGEMFNYLRGVTEAALAFPNLRKDVDQLEEWIVQGLISRKLILPWLKQAFVPDTGTVELAVREEPYRVARAAYEWMVATYFPTQPGFTAKGRDEDRRDKMANFDPESTKVNPEALFFEDKAQMTRHFLGWLQMVFGRIVDPITGEDLFSLMFLPILAGQKPRIQLDMKTLLSFHDRDFELLVFDQAKIVRPDLHELVRDWLTDQPSSDQPRTAPKEGKRWQKRLPGPVKSAIRFMSW